MITEYFLNRKLRILDKIENKKKKKRKILLIKKKISLKRNSIKKEVNLLKLESKWIRLKRWLIGSKRILVHMHYIDNNRKSFSVPVIDGKFKISDREYIVDEKASIYNKTAKMMEYNYHEKCTLPIILNYDKVIDEINDSKKDSMTENIEMSMNPKTLSLYIKSKFVQKIMEGADLDQMMNFVKIMLVINALGIGVCLLLLIKDVRI